MCKDKSQCWRDYEIVVHFRGESGFWESMKITTLAEFKNYFEVSDIELREFILENDEDSFDEHPDMLTNPENYCIGMVFIHGFFEKHPEHGAIEFFGDWIVGGDNSNIITKEAPNE